MNARLRQFERHTGDAPLEVRAPVSGRCEGFTLVELLVAMTIFAILAGLTIAGFRSNAADRVGAAAGTLRNTLDGARSRAIRAGQPRGLRLIRDSNDPRIITSVLYIGQPDFDEGVGVLYRDGGTWHFGSPSGSTHWQALNERGLIRIGQRIEIPSSSGNWFTITNFDPEFTTPNPPDPNTSVRFTLQLAGHYEPSIRSGGNFVPVPTWTGIPYRLELAPTVLPGAEPILLPAQTCIDLDGSVVPWRSSNGNYPEPNLDIMFASNGTVIGRGATEGIFVFRTAQASDLLLARGNVGSLPTQSATPVVVANPENGHKAVALYPKTGAVLVTEINSPGSMDGDYNNQVMAPNVAYRFVLRGRGAN